MTVMSENANDAGDHTVNVLAVYVNEPNRAAQPIEISLSITENPDAEDNES